MSEQRIAELRAVFTNEVIRAIGSLARQQNVCREQGGKAVFVTGMEAAREYIVEHISDALSASPAETVPTVDDDELVRLRRIAAEKEPSQQEYLLALMRAREAELRVQELEGNVKELESERKSSENWLRAQRDVAEAKLAAETGRASETSGSHETPDDYAWARDRVTRMCASALVDAQVYRQKLLKGFGYPDEVFSRAQDHRALSIVLMASPAPPPSASSATTTEHP